MRTTEILDNRLKFELKRKMFHLYSLIFPLIYVFLSPIAMSVLLVLLCGITIYIDFARHYSPMVRYVTELFLKQIMRKEEVTGNFKISGSSYMALGITITCLLFPKGLAMTSWMILTISDCIAAIVGIKFGTSLSNGKSLIGSLSFFISSLFIATSVYFLCPYNASFFAIFFASLVTTLAEFYAKNIGVNDNLLIPTTYCFSVILIGFVY